MNLGILFGSSSNEHEVSIISASSIIKNLDKEKYNITPIYLDKQNADGTWSVASSGTNVQGSIPSGYLTILEKHGTRSGNFSINKYIELPDKIDFIGRIRIESHSYTDQWPGIYGVYNYPNSTTTLKSGFTLITTNDTSN